MPICSRLEKAFEAATRHLQAGHLAEAESHYRAIVAERPDHAASLHHLGLIAWRRGHRAEAADRIEKALRVRPDYAEAWSNLGVVLLGLGRATDAAAACRRTIALRPGHAPAWSNLGNCLRALQQIEAAVAAYVQALALQPDFAEALANLGDSLARQNRLEDALAACRRAIECAPGLAGAHLALAHVLRRLGRHEASASAYIAGLAIDPGSAPAHTDFGTVLHRLGRFDEARAAHLKAIAIEPNSADAHNNLGAVLLALGQAIEAIAACRTAVAIEPDFAEAHANLGAALARQGRFEAAIASYRTALTHRPGLGQLDIEICSLRHMICDWVDLDRACAAALAPGDIQGRSAAPFPLLNLVDSPADHLRFARAWARGLLPAEMIPPTTPPGNRGRQGHRRLRIGYLSSDFHQHATATLVAGLFECHDRAGFEIFGYSCGPDEDSAMRRRLILGLDHFVDLRSLSHHDAAARIRADAIDILVDLKGYTQDARPEILALRPAPIQVAYLGYPGTMGAACIDYALVDRVVVPPDQQVFYDEKLVHLPHCYQPNDRQRGIADITPRRQDCGLPQTSFVFCCFNASHKITRPVFAIWMRLLAEVPQAVLWLLETNAPATANLKREAVRSGITPERLVFGARLPLPDHLARLTIADLFLDTLPYNAHTTGSEALWAGLPVLTCAGQAFAGRVGASLLAAVGLPELVATSLADYEAAALFLARAPAVLAALRARLALNRNTAPLFDTARSTINLESAYRRMVEIAEAGLEPQAFAVDEADGATARSRRSTIA